MAADTAVRDAFGQWVLRPAVRERPAVRLLCVPYAGGGAAAYHGWAEALPPAVEPWVLRLPGRDSRIQEPPHTVLAGLVEAAADAVGDRLPEPFALFGHSLGAWVAFELARTLRDRFGRSATFLAVSARHAPHVPPRHRPIHALPEEDFLRVLDERFGAIPAAIRDDPDLRAMYMPTLRADTAMLEGYVYLPGPPLECPVTAFGGTDDREFGVDGLAAWRRHTTGGFALRTFPGGHFYLQPRRAELLAALWSDLSAALVP